MESSSAQTSEDALRGKIEELADGFKATAREMLDESKWKPGGANDRAYRYDKTARAETYELAAWNIAKILADTMPVRSEPAQDSVWVRKGCMKCGSWFHYLQKDGAREAHFCNDCLATVNSK